MGQQDCIRIDGRASRILRQAGHAARSTGNGKATVDHLRQAFEAPIVEDLPAMDLHTDARLRGVIERAGQIAGSVGDAISETALYDAYREDMAVAAGLDLSRLAFARHCLERTSTEPLRLREFHDTLISRLVDGAPRSE